MGQPINCNGSQTKMQRHITHSRPHLTKDVQLQVKMRDGVARHYYLTKPGLTKRRKRCGLIGPAPSSMPPGETSAQEQDEEGEYSPGKHAAQEPKERESARPGKTRSGQKRHQHFRMATRAEQLQAKWLVTR